MPGVKHAVNPVLGEYSIYGMAFDAYESGDADEQIVLAENGEAITCPDLSACGI